MGLNRAEAGMFTFVFEVHMQKFVFSIAFELKKGKNFCFTNLSKNSKKFNF